MDEQNELMVSDYEEVVPQETTEESSSGNGKYIAAGVAIGAVGIIAGRWLCKKVFRPLKRRLRDKLERELSQEESEDEISAEETDAKVVYTNGSTKEENSKG